MGFRALGLGLSAAEAVGGKVGSVLRLECVGWKCTSSPYAASWKP